jgi:tetratricopeptide (TPR) repeat protein
VPDRTVKSWQAPPAWPTLVAGHEPTVALALCVGNFPQLVRDLHPLLQTANLTELRPGSGRPAAVPGLTEWATMTVAKKSFPQALLAVGALRLAKQFDQAADLLTRCEADVPAAWRSAWANEQAALAWHRGDGEAARTLWKTQPASVPVQFNRGMAALFLGDAAEARTTLAQVVGELPEASAWYHLGRLYLTLAEAR